MGYYYKFICKKCCVSGGFFSSQAWGFGNFDIIENFKFIGRHLYCEDENLDLALRIVGEGNGLYYDYPSEQPEDFVKYTKSFMPHSNDWELVINNKWSEVESLWEKNFLKGAANNPGGYKTLNQDNYIESEPKDNK